MADAIARYAARRTRPLSWSRLAKRFSPVVFSATRCATARLSACCSRRSTLKSSARIGSCASAPNAGEGALKARKIEFFNDYTSKKQCSQKCTAAGTSGSCCYEGKAAGRSPPRSSALVATAVAAIATAETRFARLRLVNLYVSAFELRIVESPNGRGSLFRRSHFNEAEAL